MTQSFKQGDKVKWSSHGQNDAEGTVVKKLTSDTKIGDHTVRASQDDPQYLVKSDKSGNEAAHKPDALKKR